MTREFYLKKADAISAAQDIINGTNGYMVDSSADSNETWDYIDRDALTLDWGGECSAVRTYDEDGSETGVFAWWEE